MHTFPALLLALTLPLVAACPPRVHPKVHPEVTKPGPMSFHTGQNNSAPAPSVPPKSDVSTQPTTRSQIDNAPSSNGVTTRYWDCCKPSCGWPGKASVTNPVKTCDAGNSASPPPTLLLPCLTQHRSPQRPQRAVGLRRRRLLHVREPVADGN